MNKNNPQKTRDVEWWDGGIGLGIMVTVVMLTAFCVGALTAPDFAWTLTADKLQPTTDKLIDLVIALFATGLSVWVSVSAALWHNRRRDEKERLREWHDALSWTQHALIMSWRHVNATLKVWGREIEEHRKDERAEHSWYYLTPLVTDRGNVQDLHVERLQFIFRSVDTSLVGELTHHQIQAGVMADVLKQRADDRKAVVDALEKLGVPQPKVQDFHRIELQHLLPRAIRQLHEAMALYASAIDALPQLILRLRAVALEMTLEPLADMPEIIQLHIVNMNARIRSTNVAQKAQSQ